MDSAKQRKWGVILQYSNIFITILVSLLYTPIMLKILGQNEYGIYSVASSIISYLSLLSLGLSGSYLRYYSISKRGKIKNDVPKLNGLYLIVFSAIGVLSLIIGFVLSFNVGAFFNESYTASEIETAKILTFILTINLAVSFPSSVFTSYITSQEKFLFLKIVNICSAIVGPCVNIILLYSGFRSIGMVLTTTFISIIVAIVNIFYCFKKIKMKVTFKNIDYSIFKDILIFSIFISMNQIIEMITWQTDKIILGKMIGGASVAIYAIGSQINTLFTQFSGAVSSVFAPQINEITQSDDENKDKKLSDLFIKIGRIQWFILFLILSGFIFYGRYFISKWAGPGYDNSYTIALLLMCPAIICLIQNSGIEIQRAKNKHKVRSIVYLIIAIINVGISIFLAGRMGEVGCALGTTISLFVGPIVFMNIYYFCKLNIDIKKFWFEILKTLPSLIPALVFGILSAVFHKFIAIYDFVIICFIYSFIYLISIYFFGLNNYEKFTVKTILNKINIFKRRNRHHA